MKRVIILTEKEYENAMQNVRHDEDLKFAEFVSNTYAGCPWERMLIDEYRYWKWKKEKN